VSHCRSSPWSILFLQAANHTVAYILALSVYMTVTIPALRTIVTPQDVDTRDDRIEAMRVLAAGNTIIVVILGGVLLLQVGLNFVILS
jgi:hypothetical protein